MANEYQTTNFEVILGYAPDFVGAAVIGAAYLAKANAVETRDELLADLDAALFDPATVSTQTYAIQEQGSSIVLTSAAVDRATFLAEITNDRYTVVLFAKYNDGVDDVYVRFAAVPVSLLRTLDE